MTNPDWDVVIVGGGPGGSTTGTLLKKYRPDLRVLILEREHFPREHIGESQLPVISEVLDEMGCWDKVEAADFPIKIGATFRWGQTPELWDFEFLPLGEFKNEPRPAKYEGARRQTAFQVDRAVYDDILLRHAADCGCEVRQGTAVAKVHNEGDRITGLTLSTGETVTARYYVDASGNAAVIRRAMGVTVACPTHLKNIAIWDYWENAEWAVEIGVGGTRIQVMTVGYGWLWFIPLGPKRTSLGLVCPASYYKDRGLPPEALYEEALKLDDRIARLIAKGTRTGTVRTTTDWSFLADRTVGANWFLVGECAGFADPILSAGMSLTHTGARELAYTILELDRGGHDRDWLLTHYDRLQRQRVGQHIRFADFWYAANGQLTDLQEHCQQIAREAGLDLTAKQSWGWLARGGFALDVAGQAGLGGYSLAAVKGITARFADEPAVWRLNDVNVLELDLTGATQETVPVYANGAIAAAAAYVRGNHRLVCVGIYDLLVRMLARPTEIAALVRQLGAEFAQVHPPPHVRVAVLHAFQVLEVMLSEGWVRGTFDPTKPRLALETPQEGEYIHTNRDPGGKS